MDYMKKYSETIDTVTLLLSVISEVREACNKVIDDNKQWAKDNDCDIEMSDSIKGWDDMARDILAIIDKDDVENQ